MKKASYIESRKEEIKKETKERKKKGIRINR